MLDPDEITAYNEWKALKLAGAQDLSIEAYNTEMGMQASAYDKGVDAAFAGAIVRQNAEEVKAKSPYRKPGMRGHTP
jgi:hypothetical protein